MPRIGHSFNAEIRHYARMDWTFPDMIVTGFSPTIGTVHLIPFQARYGMTIDRLGHVNMGTVAGNCIHGVYEDNGDVPDGGAVVVESASVACAGALQKQEVTIADTHLDAGLYWLAARFSDNTHTLLCVSPRMGIGGTLQTAFYAGAYGPLTDPCPATAVVAENCWQFVRVKSVP